MPYYAGPGTDHYAPSKQQAEKMVLAWGGAACSLRPAAIYGPGEERHFPRIAMVVLPSKGTVVVLHTPLASLAFFTPPSLSP